MPEGKAYAYPEEYAGLSVQKKLHQVREKMEKLRLDCYVAGALDSVCWLFNLRGSDVSISPLFTGFAMVAQDEAILFADRERIPDALAASLEAAGVQILPCDSIYSRIGELPGRGRIGFSARTVNAAIYDGLGDRVDRVLLEDDIVEHLKMVKNHVELQHIRTAHKHDGIAMVRFLMWLERAIRTSRLTEWNICEKLVELRSARPEFRGSPLRPSPAMEPTEPLSTMSPPPTTAPSCGRAASCWWPRGAQYLGRTTDITRPIPLGEVPGSYRRDYALVFQAFIRLHSARFLEGCTGKSLDVLARQVIWDNYLDYKHGTGHGVHWCVNVHEGPNNFSNAHVPLEEGMIISIEPGIYRAGMLGVRTENLVTIVRDKRSDEFGQFYRFEPLTLCPINTKAIEVKMLSRSEVVWLNQYHSYVFEQLSPMLEPEERKWLGNATAPLHI
ncbi:MAG: aminopeptidase P family N-terminal domain-containing protein [Acutalibacteraceae bacterium]